MNKLLKKLLLVSLIFTVHLFGGFSSALNKQHFLPPEVAFQTTAIQKGNLIETTITMADKIHIYDDTLHYRIVSPEPIELEVKKPTPLEIDGDKVYAHQLKVTIPLSEIRQKIRGDYTLEISFQGCSDAGICYQPITKQFSFKGAQPAGFFEKISSLAKSGNTDKIADALANESWIFDICFVTLFYSRTFDGINPMYFTDDSYFVFYYFTASQPRWRGEEVKSDYDFIGLCDFYGTDVCPHWGRSS